MRVSLDVDGVTAGFNQAVAALAKQLNVTTSYELLDAWIDDHEAEFWSGLTCVLTPADRKALRGFHGRGHAIFWLASRPITNRMHVLTREWLAKQRLPSSDARHVILTMDKARAMRENEITNHLTDRIPHAMQIALGGRTAVILRRPWNTQELWLSQSEEHFQVVDSVAQFLEAVNQ